MHATIEPQQQTVLVVDDQAPVLRIVADILRAADFLVLTAVSGPNALLVAAAAEGEIDLLLSDVDMPEMSGPQLGQALKKVRPTLRVMLMSGGGNGSLLVLNYGWAFITKPFLAVRLVAMVRSVLDSPDRSQSDGEGFDSRKDASSAEQKTNSPTEQF